MKGSLKIAQLFGIPVKLHWSFSLLIVYVIYSGFSIGFSWDRIALMGLSLLGLFFCVVMHEYGHALTARKYGVQTKDIILSPIGGIARLERLPEKPIQEFYVAVAGPLVNIAIAILIIPLFILIFGKDIQWNNGFVKSLLNLIDFSGPSNILPFLLLGNIALAGFNLLPAFPMDGGRIFRSLLSIKLGRLRATRIASYLGNLFGIAMIVYGFFGEQSSIVTSLIGVFIFLLATYEYRMVKLETVLKNNYVKDMFRENYTSLYLDLQMAEAADLLKRGSEKNFLIFDRNDQLVGVLHEMFIMEAIRKNDLEAPIASYLSNRYEVIRKNDDLDTIVKKMQRFGYSILPVYEEQQLVGVVDASMVNHFLRLQKKINA